MPGSFVCDRCGLVFQRANALKYHIRTHTGEKPLKCDICGMRFARPDALTRHTLTHTNERPYPCEVCNKAFKTRQNLTIHKRIHSGERPYKCNDCNAAFIQQPHLKLHQTIHTKTGPHQCGICGCRFNLESNLSSHQLAKHSDASTSQFVTAHTHLEPMGIVSVTTQPMVSSGATISTITSPIGSAYMVTKETSSATITTAIRGSGRVNTDTNQNFPDSDSWNLYQDISLSELQSDYDYDSDDSFSDIPD